MRRTEYSTEQIKTLLKNRNVTKCSTRSVAYRKEFKIWAVKEYYAQGIGPNAIFQKAGFDLNVLGRDKPKSCLRLWRRIYKTQGEEGLMTESRGRGGGRKALNTSTDVKYLQTKLAYLEAENRFLKKLKTNKT